MAFLLVFLAGAVAGVAVAVAILASLRGRQAPTLRPRVQLRKVDQFEIPAESVN